MIVTYRFLLLFFLFFGIVTLVRKAQRNLFGKLDLPNTLLSLLPQEQIFKEGAAADEVRALSSFCVYFIICI